MTIGKYKILSEIKKEGFFEAYRALYKPFEREVFIKCASKDLPEDIVKRFEKEAELLFSITHPNVVKIYDIFEKENKKYIVMEWVDGIDLSRLIQISGKIPPKIASFITYQILDILEDVHQKGIIHRDIKPSNILISKDGFIKLTDFGIAREEEAPHITKPGVVIGTPFYMSPEQVRGEEVSPSSDIFSTGIVLYEMVTGKKPFTGKDTTQILIRVEKENPDFSRKIFKNVPKKLKKIIKKALEKDPEKRFKNAEEFKKELIKFIGLDFLPEGRKELKRFLERQLETEETLTHIEKKQIKIPFFRGKYRFIGYVIPLILLSITGFYYGIKNLVYPEIEIKANLKSAVLKIDGKIHRLPFKGRIPPGEKRIKLIAPYFYYEEIFNAPIGKKKTIELKEIKDSLIMKFRGEGTLYVNHKEKGKDSVDIKLIPGEPYLFTVIKDKDTLINFYTRPKKKEVIFFRAFYKDKPSQNSGKSP